MILEKFRDKYSGEVLIDDKSIPDITDGRDIIILDDIISTGSSIVKANLHNVFSFLINEYNIRRILDTSVENIITTNSIPNRFAKVGHRPCSRILRSQRNLLRKPLV